MEKDIYFFVGTTAEYIKLAPIVRELNKRKIKFKIITTGQNKVNLEAFSDFTGKVEPYIEMAPKGVKSSLPLFFFWSLKTFLAGIFLLRKEFRNKKKNNTYFLVHGDTVSALLGSLIAKVHNLTLVHIESGLRSFDFLEPIPEEINRFAIIHLADILFAPNNWALKNLRKMPGTKVNTVQNTLIETCLWALKKKSDKRFINKLDKYFILFMHRQEHVYVNKKWTRDILDLVITNAPENLNCVIVMHALSSRFLQAERLNALDAKIRKRLILVPKLPYLDFMKLMKNAEFIATDGCTNQEEAYYMGLPLLALRNLTERTEGLKENVVISKGSPRIIKNFLKTYKNYRRNPVKIKGRPSEVVVDYLLSTTLEPS